MTYRVGNHQPQNVYRDDQYIGVMFTAEDAALAVEALNGQPQQCTDEWQPAHRAGWRPDACATCAGLRGTLTPRCHCVEAGYPGPHPRSEGCQPPHPTCVDVSNLRAGRPPGSEWVCGAHCPSPYADREDEAGEQRAAER